MLVLLGVLFTIILAGLDNTIVSTVMPVALPELGGAHLYAWTFAAYMLAAAVSMPIWGPGSDRWGRRRTYLIGIVAFTVGSGLCAIARTMMEFIGARAIQGIGAGAVATLPFVLLGVVYPPNKRGRALGAASSAGRNKTESITAKMARFAPRQIATVASAVTVKAGVLRSWRRA